MRVFTQFENRPLLFDSPVEVILANEPSGVPAAFIKMEEALSAGRYLAGFISYEAGYVLNGQAFERRTPDFPLVMMGVYKEPVAKDVGAVKSQSWALKDLRLNISREDYGRDIDAIRDYIASGEVYQITYCLKLKFDLKGDARALYRELLRQQPVPYSALIEADGVQILSLSPERFIKKTGNQILTEPMKGTWPRGKGPLMDLWHRLVFSRDRKNRAENVMIADLLRNDLGRIGQNIQAPQLFTVTAYRTLFQMTSTVTGDVPKDVALWDLFAALFPSGSVTGAPKLRAMEIIRELEGEDRRIYTGAIGYVTPSRDMYFNIPIRTILSNGKNAEMGIGGGIVWDSTADGEWSEGLLKSKFITEMSDNSQWE